jgi:hypothetical protein
MPPLLGTLSTVNRLFERTTSCTFSKCSCFDVDSLPEHGESSFEFQLSLSICTTHKFVFGLRIRYQSPVIFQMYEKVPLI